MLAYLLYALSGFCTINAIPHFVKGVCGEPFPSPFGRPPGVGESSPLVNVAWGGFNFVAGYLLTTWAGAFEIGLNAPTASWGAGATAVSVILAVHFGRLNGSDLGGGRNGTDAEPTRQ